MKKFLLFFIACAILSSCGNAKSDDKQEITLWHYFSEPDAPIFLEYIKEFNSIQDKYKVVAEFVSREELLKQYAMGLVAGELPDIGMIDNPDQASFSQAGLFEDITDRFNAWEDNKFLEGPLESVKYNERVYGLPYAALCLALFYDEDVLREANVAVPTNWEELREAAKKLTTANTKALAWSSVKNEEGTFQFLPFMVSAGGDINHVNSAAGINALSLLTEFVKNGWASKEVLVWTQSDVEKQFSSGKAAMMINGPWNINAVLKQAPNKKWSVAKIPMDMRYASVLGGENFAVMKGKNVDGAWEFLKWFCSTEVSEKYCKTIKKFSSKANADIDKMYGDDTIMKVFANQMEYAMPRGPHPKWPEISYSIISAVHESISMNKTPKEALDLAQITIDKINNK